MIGRTRQRVAERVAEALRAEGFEMVVDPSSLYPAQGYWRTDIRADVMRWHGSVRVKNPPDWSNSHRTINIGSWDTMTDCARGLTIAWESGWEIMVYANKSREHPTLARIKSQIEALP